MDKITIKGYSTITKAEVAGDAEELERLDIEVNNLSQVSDGYHTIAELYDHRITLYIALCKAVNNELRPPEWGTPVWRSKLHFDGSSYEGWFILGIFTVKGNQISYHLPLDRWDETNFAETLDQAPEWDGHTSNDVLTRLKAL